jgi:hypothetical protein
MKLSAELYRAGKELAINYDILCIDADGNTHIYKFVVSTIPYKDWD